MLAVKPLSSITISEIAENAKVDRRTFYRHFKTKEDVITYYIHIVSKQYEEIVFQNTINDSYSFAKAIFETCLSMKEILQILYKQNLLDLYFVNFETIYKNYQYKHIKPELLMMENIDYILSYDRGGVTNIVKKWITEGCIISPENMTEIIMQLFVLIKDTLKPI